MEVIRAKTAGFCFGVERAVNTVYEQIEAHSGEPIYTFGPIIHNEEVIKDLEKKGVAVLRTEEELDALKKGVVIIRSHGVEKRIYDELNKKGITIVDATCPFVKKIHNIVQKESNLGRYIVIIGNPDHPEVEGIRGWAGERVSVVQNAEDIENLSLNEGEKVCVVSQTTFNYNKFQDLVEIIREKSYDICVLNTICNATKERQTEAKRIAEENTRAEAVRIAEKREKAEAEAREKVRIAAEKKAALEKAEQNRKAELSERNRKLALEREISGLSTLWQMPFR